MSQELYLLSWKKSTDPLATTQSVTVLANGVAVPVVLSNPATDESVNVTFDTGANVEWFVTTFGSNGTQSDSVHDTFVATDQTPPAPVAPATNLSQVWVSHTA